MRMCGIAKNICGATVVALALVGCKAEEQPEKIRPVVTRVVEWSERNTTLIFPGVAKSTLESDVSFRVPGLIDEFPIKVGDELRDRDLLAALQDNDYQLELDRARSGLEEAEAEARNAVAQYRRIKALYESESASRNELDSARAAFEATRAAVAGATSAVELAVQQLSYTRLYAKDADCFVSAVYTEVAENVAAGQAIATLTCGSSLEVEVPMPEVYIAQIRQGQTGTIYFNALPDEAYAGTVTKVGVASLGGTTFPVTVELDKRADNLRAGMAATVYFDDGSKQKIPMLVVPLTAVGNDLEGTFIYVFEAGEDDTGVARRHKVEVGHLYPEGLEVRSGIEPGDRIIIAGVRFLSDGRVVKLKAD